MALNLSPLDTASRLLVQATLSVALGTGGRFQPTGFPDLGPALYKGFQQTTSNNESSDDTSPKRDREEKIVSVDMLLVESVQSIANRLEEVCLQGEDYNTDCQGIPYVRVQDGHNSNSFLTSSVREPHRLASPYVLDAKRSDGKTMKQWLSEPEQFSVNKARPVRTWTLAQRLFGIDPGCVLHGVFLEELDGRLRLPRLVSGYIEACSPNQANSGGVYRGEVTAKDNIPYSRQEFTSTAISASFIFHTATLNGYGLQENQRRFLQLWALYKIDRFLNSYLRLRTACEFELGQVTVLLDGKPVALFDTSIEWPSGNEIRSDFIARRDQCFPRRDSENQWDQRRVAVVTYAVDIVGLAPLPEGVVGDAFKLEGFQGRAEVKMVAVGKGRNKKMVNSLVLSGEWSEDDQNMLLEQNPDKKQDDSGEDVDNPANAVVKAALEKWNEAWKKQQKKQAVTEESGG